MTSLYYPPKFDSGLAGAKLTFSITGTSTLQNTYTDEALTIASSNPVVADASGVFAPIYMDPKLPSYRVKFTTAADVTIYQVDNVPSNQNIQQSIRLEATNPYIFLYDTDGTANARKYRIRAAGNTFQVQLSNDAESVFTTIIEYTGGTLYSGQTEVAITQNSSFTGTLTGMTGTVTGTIYYRKVSNQVTLWAESNITGTSNTTAMTMTGLPAILTPGIDRKILSASGSDNGAEVCLANTIGTANIITFATLDSSVAKLTPNGAFTNSGTKGLLAGWTVTYTVL